MAKLDNTSEVDRLACCASGVSDRWRFTDVSLVPGALAFDGMGPLEKAELLPLSAQSFTGLGASVHLLLGQLARDAAWGMPGVTLAVRFPQGLKLSWEPWDIVIAK